MIEGKIVDDNRLNRDDVPMEDDGLSIALSPDIVVLSQEASTAAEAIRQLRTRLVAQHLARGRRALVLCSPGPDSGCSFVAANLAVAFGQIGTRVLLVNGDLRSPGLDASFGEPGFGEGLLSHLAAEDQPENAPIHQIMPSLWLLPAGGSSQNAQELLATHRFELLCDRFVREFDLTIIDTPPASSFADAHRIATVIGYAAIVARSDRTYFDDVTELTKQLQADRVNVVGTILNQC